MTVSQTRDIIEALKEAGGNPRYTEFPDAAHNIWADADSDNGQALAMGTTANPNSAAMLLRDSGI